MSYIIAIVFLFAIVCARKQLSGILPEIVRFNCWRDLPVSLIIDDWQKESNDSKSHNINQM
jgi:hypothetical protein